ncbi:glycosyltransferase family 4 protein [Nocardioides speluncae]|uniref:glycosyltransferase family 4 protein n=1 Tax=Nocardioides speluncae TaxID=2670337 RepID=UPI000D68A8FB|nr:glycosyltransferase family 4 protein [Nocardioides speluncae]
MTPVVGRVHFVVPEGIDDPARPSGGNVYDRRLAAELTGLGWTVHEHHVAGSRLLAEIPDRAITVVDGLVGTAEVMVTEAARLRLVLLVHMPLGGPVERAVLNHAAAVITTSQWARGWLITQHGLAADKVSVALPGVDPAPVVAGSAGGTNLLCVGPVVREKGYDVLMDALRNLPDLAWHCTVAGALDLEPGFVADSAGVADRVSFLGPVTQARLDTIRSATDLVVSASRRESFGMAVAEGLARGIPVVATDVGGHPEVVGPAGVLVPAGDPVRLASALREWLTDPRLRDRLRRAAIQRSGELTTWADTASAVNRSLLALVSPSNSQLPNRQTTAG